VLAHLVDYTKFHFGHEAEVLRMHGYPGLDDHLKLHEVFRAKVGELDAQVKAGTLALSVPVARIPARLAGQAHRWHVTCSTRISCPPRA
jgi:hypothetical protein